MIFKNSTPFETSDANELFKKLLSTTSVTNREYNRNRFFSLNCLTRVKTSQHRFVHYICNSCMGEIGGGEGGSHFLLFHRQEWKR